MVQGWSDPPSGWIADAMGANAVITRPVVWVVWTMKGGVGKTMTAAMLAFCEAMKGEEVAAIDADPGTQGLTEWALTVEDTNSMPFFVDQWSAGESGLLVPFAKRAVEETGATRLIVDARDDMTIGEQAIRLVQWGAPGSRVISPVGPDTAELLRVGPTRAIVAGRPGTPHSYALTKVPVVGAGSAKQGRADIERDHGVHVLTTEVPRNRETYADVVGHIPATCGAYADMAAELHGLADVNAHRSGLVALAGGEARTR